MLYLYQKLIWQLQTAFFFFNCCRKEMILCEYNERLQVCMTQLSLYRYFNMTKAGDKYVQTMFCNTNQLYSNTKQLRHFFKKKIKLEHIQNYISLELQLYIWRMMMMIIIIKIMIIIMYLICTCTHKSTHCWFRWPLLLCLHFEFHHNANFHNLIKQSYTFWEQE